MLDIIEQLVIDKNEIEMEEMTTVKMLVPFSFNLKDGKCEDEEVQKLYEFLTHREDVIEETETTESLETETIENPAEWQN